MKVNGQLEGAQLEQLAANPTPASTARIYANITNPLAAVPMFFNGTAWRPLSLGQSTAFISQNSGKACTVNWAQGLNQEVTLTDNCLISFSNPVAGEQHTLIIKQGPVVAGVAKTYVYKFNMIDQDTQFTEYQPNIVLNASTNYVHRWLYKAGIRVGYANVSANIPSTGVSPATLGSGVAISPLSSNVYMGRTSSPFLTGFALDKPKFTVPTLNTPYAGALTPLAIAATPLDMCFHPNGHTLFTAMQTSPYLQASKFTAASVGITDNTQAIASNPGALPTGIGRSVSVHPSGYFVALGHGTTPFMSIYGYNSIDFTLKIANPATLPFAQVNAIQFSPMGDYIAAATQSTPFIQVWAFDASTGPFLGSIGAYVAQPNVVPAGGPGGGNGNALAWRPQGDYLVMGMSVSPYLYVTPFDRATGAFPSFIIGLNALAGAVNCVKWTPDGQYLIVGIGVAPFVYVFDFSVGTMTNIVTFDGSGPGQAVTGIDVDPTGTFATLALGGGSFIWNLVLPQKTKNYLKIPGV